MASRELVVRLERWRRPYGGRTVWHVMGSYGDKGMLCGLRAPGFSSVDPERVALVPAQLVLQAAVRGVVVGRAMRRGEQLPPGDMPPRVCSSCVWWLERATHFREEPGPAPGLAAVALGLRCVSDSIPVGAPVARSYAVFRWDTEPARKVGTLGGEPLEGL